MTRKLKREIKAAYRCIRDLDRVSDDTVFEAYIGQFDTNKQFLEYLWAQTDMTPDDIAAAMRQENLNFNGMWMLYGSDIAHGVIQFDGHYFWRNV